MATDTVPMTAEEFLRLPDAEGVTRELIEGVVAERAMTTRSPKHTTCAAEITFALRTWLARSARLGVVSVGEVRCRLTDDPATIVGIDVAYFEGTDAIRQSREESCFDGPPVVAVEILSPTDTHEDVGEKIHRYLAAGTKQVWIADPDFRTVTVHRADAPPAFYHHLQDLPGGPDLPGFQVPVGSLFGP